MECIKLRLQDGAMFFPLDEIRSAKGTTSAGLSAIAFTGRSTGGLQFIKYYREREERDRILQAIAEQTEKAEQKEAAERAMANSIKRTNEKFQGKKNNTKKAGTKKKKTAATLSDDEIEKLMDERNLSDELKEELRIWIEYKAKERKFRYKKISFKTLMTRAEKETETNGIEKLRETIELSIANGYQGIAWGKTKQAKKEMKKSNQFNQFEQNEYSDEELEELENSSVS